MLRKTLRAIGWTAAGLVGLCVLLYLVALAINWRDREPSAAALRFTELYRDRPAVADEANGYVFLQHWEVENPREKLPARVQEFVKACRPGESQCVAAALDAADGLFDEWHAADSSLLDRYLAFTAHTGWREAGSPDIEGSIPSYSRASDGQKLLLLRARELAKRGDAAAVGSLLERDLQFWRLVLQSSDILISKMVATAMLNRHFEWGNLVLRELPVASQAAAIPAGWRRANSDAERSMERCIAGEWLFASETLRRAPADSFGVDENVPIARAATWLLLPMYQPQDTINQYAEHYSSLARAFEVPLSSYPRVVDDVRKRTDQAVAERFPFGGVYNLPGGLIFALTMMSADLAGYAVRVSDVEGVRRAALTAVMLRAAGVEVKDMSAALANAAQHDPYTDRPFEWDEEDRAIVFRGLQTGERGEHRILY